MRKLFLSLLTVVLVTTGFGCKGLDEEQQAAIKPVVLNYWTVYNNVPELKRLALQYQAIRPYVTINIRQLRVEEYQEKFLTALADDVGPDIVSIHVRDVKKHISRLSPAPASVKVANVQIKDGFNKETIVTIEQKTLPTVTTLKNNYVKTVASDAIFENKIYGLPLTVDTMALYYNKDLLDQAGVATPPATWEEFVEAVKATTKLDINNPANIIQSGVALGTGNNIDNAPDIYSLLLLQKGVKIIEGDLVTFPENPNRGQASPALETLSFYTDFADPTKEVYTWNENQGNAFEEFVRGKSVFYFGFAFDGERIKTRAPQMNVAITPMLQLNTEVPVNVASYWLESVTKKSKHQNEAWDFIRFLSTPDTIKAYSALAKTPSALRVHNKDQKNEENPLYPFALQVLQAENWYHGKDYTAGKSAFTGLITGYLKPYGEEEDPEKRDNSLIINAARTLQQTL